jgi:hypothetical protein
MAFTMLSAMLTPSLGVTGVLAALWAVAATLGGAEAPSTRALDPAVAGSVAAAWGTLQLGAVALLGLAVGAPWPLILGPALLLLGEAGELHLILAAAVGGQGAAAQIWAKSAAAAALGLLAIAPLFRDVRSRPAAGTIVACLALGGCALALDVAQGELHGQGPLLASLEEWCELTMESLLTAAYLAAVSGSLLLGRLDRRSAWPRSSLRRPRRRDLAGRKK